MRILAAALLALAAFSFPAHASKLPSRTTIVALTDDLVQRYIACVDSVVNAVGRSRGTVEGTGPGPARKRMSAANAARAAALSACGWRGDDHWRYTFNSVNLVRHGGKPDKLYVNGEATTKGVAKVHAANRKLLKKYPVL